MQIDLSEIRISFIRAPGPGGQNVNKVATAVLLRVSIKHAKFIPESIRPRLLNQLSSKLTQHGDLLIKASSHRTQERNRQDALERLKLLLQRASIIPKKRKKTKPTRSSVEKRIEKKKLRGKVKAMRRGVE